MLEETDHWKVDGFVSDRQNEAGPGVHCKVARIHDVHVRAHAPPLRRFAKQIRVVEADVVPALEWRKARIPEGGVGGEQSDQPIYVVGSESLPPIGCQLFGVAHRSPYHAENRRPAERVGRSNRVTPAMGTPRFITPP